MFSEPAYIAIPGAFITFITAIPLWYFYRRSDRQIYKARSPLLSINCLIFELICFWIILVSSVINYNEELPTQMNVTLWQCPNENSVINLDRQVTLNTILIAIFTARINPYFWIVIVLDLWVVVATGYIVIYVDMKQQGESYVLFHETLIENIQNFMLHKDQYDYKQIFSLFLNNLAYDNKKSSFSSQVSENHLKKSMIIYDLYIDIILIEININEDDSEIESIQAQNNNNNNAETQIQSQFQSIISDYFTPTNKDTYLGALYGIDQQCRRNMDLFQQSETSSVSISNQLVNVIITKTKSYMNEFFNEFKKTHSFHFIRIMMANNSSVCQRLASFNLISFNNQ
ncbi:transmembrane protein, putative (macronuclear) [Tetrahymena thermophila SB210]|uniref:Transmembrane protein, putative n=1 Tax=Tetrahymena thermophila (strain SB210) TaxID=312017 RepID=W7XGJ0_TETTS|nr:transmembrane protein, putative [Tetrahymena thermophila SB210]EWS72029.1 transmembrane protein, putative [Tetrahymena thermophila SB210]|eukprot:XP_012655436.1 transmembrane protein, putative [Tetrahymena thermophila SB210]